MTVLQHIWSHEKLIKCNPHSRVISRATLGARLTMKHLWSDNQWASKARKPFQNRLRRMTKLICKRIRTLQERASRNSLRKHNSTSLLPSEFSWSKSPKRMRQALIMSKTSSSGWMNLLHLSPRRGKRSTPSSTRASTSQKRQSLLSMKILRLSQNRSQSARP